MKLKRVIEKLRPSVVSDKVKTLEAQYEKSSFSQSGEDLIVKYVFDCLGMQKPSYLDIGAHHPYYLSNTALFYRNGSRGINVEPDPELFKEFLAHRKDDINLNIGIGNKNDEMDFYIISSPTLNTFSKEEALKYSCEGDYSIQRIEKIKVRTLGNILDEFCGGTFPQFLSIDAEGVDELIVKQIDFAQNFPIIICIETISFSTSGNGKKNISLIDYIGAQGYLPYADTNINTIFVKRDFWQKQTS